LFCHLHHNAHHIVMEHAPVPKKTAKDKPYDPSTPLPEGKREAFVQQYLIDLNGSAAAIRAGYAPSGAKTQAHRLLTDDNLQARVRWLKSQRSERLGISADSVVAELAKIGFASMRRFISIDRDGQPSINLANTPDDDLDALSEVSTETVMEGPPDGKQYKVRKTRVRMHSKLDALRHLAEHVGVFDKANRVKADALAAAFEAVFARGSKAPLRRDSDGGGQ
jgi:phage terminase small subunit